MQYGPELADPLVDVRDIVESFRAYGITPSDWRATLRNAVSALDELAPKPQLNLLLPSLVAHINQLLANGLATDTSLVAEVADQVSTVLSSVEIPAMPTPADPNWTFVSF